MKDFATTKDENRTPIQENNPISNGTEVNNFIDQSETAQEAQTLQDLATQHQTEEVAWQNQLRGDTRKLPTSLQTEIEQATGQSLQAVQVHYNSPLPAQHGARAMAEYPNIYIGPGNEDSLEEEAWHLAQQLQGKVTANDQASSGLPINNSQQLEEEATKGEVQDTQETTTGKAVVQLDKDPRLSEYKDSKKTDYDPSKLSDAVIKETKEYKKWKKDHVKGSKKKKATTYTEQDLLLACRLAIRDIRSNNKLKVLSKGKEYLERAKKQEAVINQAEEGLKGEKDPETGTQYDFKWKEQNLKFTGTHFSQWLINNKPEPLPGDQINCYEYVLYSAYKANVIKKPALQKVYQKLVKDLAPYYVKEALKDKEAEKKRAATALEKIDAILRKAFWQGNEQVYDPVDSNSPTPLRGDLVVFKTFSHHTAIATGKTTASGEIEVISLDRDGKGKPRKTTIQQLLKAGSPQPVRFSAAKW